MGIIPGMVGSRTVKSSAKVLVLAGLALGMAGLAVGAGCAR